MLHGFRLLFNDTFGIVKIIKKQTHNSYSTFQIKACTWAIWHVPILGSTGICLEALVVMSILTRT